MWVITLLFCLYSQGALGAGPSRGGELCPAVRSLGSPRTAAGESTQEKKIKEINKKPFHSFTLTFSAASLQTALALLHLRISEDKITYVLFSPVNYLCRRVRRASRDVCRRNKTGCQCSRQSGSSPSAPLRVGDIDWHNMPRGVRVCVCVSIQPVRTHTNKVRAFMTSASNSGFSTLIIYSHLIFEGI